MGQQHERAQQEGQPSQEGARRGGAGSRALGTARPAAEGGEGRGLDRRVVRSRRAIMAAFERLVMERPLSQITVSAIAREADVDRKTFYLHFGSIDGLLDEMARRVVDRVLDSVEQSREAAGDAGGLYDERALEAFFPALATALSEDLALNRRLIESIPAEDLLRHLAEPLSCGIRRRGLVSAVVDEQTLDLCLSFELGGLLSLFRTWALSDEVTIEQVTQLALAITGGGVREVSLSTLGRGHAAEAPERDGDGRAG